MTSEKEVVVVLKVLPGFKKIKATVKPKIDARGLFRGVDISIYKTLFGMKISDVKEHTVSYAGGKVNYVNMEKSPNLLEKGTDVLVVILDRLIKPDMDISDDDRFDLFYPMDYLKLEHTDI